MAILVVVIVTLLAALIGFAMSVRIVQQYEEGVLFRLGRVISVRQPGLSLIVPVVDVLRRVSKRIVTMPIQSRGIITRDNVSVDVSAVAYYRVVDATKSVVAIENIAAAINQIAQTTLRKVVGEHTLDETLAHTDRINADIRPVAPPPHAGLIRRRAVELAGPSSSRPLTMVHDLLCAQASVAPAAACPSRTMEVDR